MLGSLWAQKPYFQQRVEYFIRVQLDPATHALRGHVRFRYINRSPDTLTGLYIHLWPNAYSRRGTAFDRQQRITGKSRFYFAKAGERGRIDSLDFRVGGQPARPLPAVQGPPPAPGYSTHLLKQAPDVVWLPLPTPLLPGQSVEVETPFRVQVPITFSRMGRSGPQYQITQWYPKPAVYDRQGWHPLPYLDQGEFYSEWGRYEVEITVPSNYVVGATGVLQNGEEQAWLQARAAETRAWIAQRAQSVLGSEKQPLPRVSLSIGKGEAALEGAPAWATETKPAPTYKTLRFVQDSVHDFAWFADPRYGVLADTVTLHNGHRVACVALFRLPYYSAWQHAPRYIALTLDSLSRQVGPYPYAHATAVEGGLEAGGGMEYPMITVIVSLTDTASLKTVVVHEVGHNWFQGLLGSNERLHPWQDEGVNSYYERRLTQEAEVDTPAMGKAKVNISGISLPLQISSPALLGSPYMALYHHLNADQPFSLSSERYSLLGYGIGVYQRTAYLLAYYARQVGVSFWDQVMQAYFRRWAFRHPYPEDWASVLEGEGQKGRVLLRTLLSDKEPDFQLQAKRLQGLTYQVRVTQPVDSLWAGLPVSAIAVNREGRLLGRYALPMDSLLTITLPEGTHLFAVNPEQVLFERRVSNNFFYTRGLLRTWQRPSVRRGPIALPTMGQTHIGVLPAVGYNYRDGLLVGVFLNHGLFPKRIVEWHLLPMYSLLRNDLRGSAGITLRAFPSGRLQLVEGRLRTASFAGFWRTKASVEATFRRGYDTFGWRHVLRLRSYHLAYQSLESRTYSWENAGRPAYVALDWEGRREEAILTLYSMASVGHDLQGHLRAEAEGRLSWKAARKWRPWARLYAGWTDTRSPAYLQFRPAGYDPFGEMVLLDRFREAPTPLLRQQMPETQGGWRAPTDTLFTSGLIAANVELPLPGFSAVGIRADAGYLPQENRTYWGVSLGLPVVRFRDRFVLGGYFPIWGDAFAGGRPRAVRDIVERFVWSVQVPLDLRWAIPW